MLTDQSLSAGGEKSEKLDQTPSSAFRVPPPHSVDAGRIQLRISSTSLAGNGLRTHLVYKFELSYENYTWWIQKKHSDFEDLDSEVRRSTNDSNLLACLPRLPKRETVLTLFGSNHSNSIVKRCRKLCRYLRGVLCSNFNNLPYLKVFLKLKNKPLGGGSGDGHLSNFQGYLGGIVKEGSFEVCAGCSTLETVSYFKRRYAALSKAGLFMYRHHDDSAKDHVNSLPVDVFMNGVLHAEKIQAAKRRRGREVHAHWRVWVEDGQRFGKNGYAFRHGRRGSFSKVSNLVGEEVDSRWSIVCRGTERMCNDWLVAVSNVGVVLMSGEESVGFDEVAKIKDEIRRKMTLKDSTDSMTESSSGSSGTNSLVESESDEDSSRIGSPQISMEF
ncbi:hypothetical protein TrST_g5850 [Triparma strigata]|uniref:PX domain-containing protein n=1 Tax=Triparma strigata TaxID=1606541 RepID=A0A9W7EK37_9STRA|nr:hypothetical protein TrST_g5850 [Triparma strigata]